MHVHGDDDDGEKDNDGTVTIPEGHLCWMGSRGSRSDYSMHSVTLPLCPHHPHNGLSQQRNWENAKQFKHKNISAGLPLLSSEDL